MLNLHHLPGSALQERSIHVVRAHIITLLPMAFVTVIIFLLPPLGYYGLQMANPTIWETPAHFTLYVLGASIFFLYSVLFTFQSFIDYWLDVFIVTEKRILNIKQHGLFHRTVSELRMYRIQDVTTEIHGILHTMFDFGNIHIQTAGEIERFAFHNIWRPNDIAKMILEFSEADRKAHIDEAVEELGSVKKS